MNISDALDFLAEEMQAQGVDQYDIIGGNSESSEVSVFEEKIKSIEHSVSQGVGVRAFIDNNPGYAYTEKLSKEALTQTVRDAVSHTKLTGSLKIALPSDNTLPDIDLNLYQEGIEHVNVEAMKDYAFEVEKCALAADDAIENVPYLGVGKDSGMMWLRNSNGIHFHNKRNSISAGLGAVAKKGEMTKMGVYSKVGRDFSEFDAQFMAEESVRRALELIDPKPIQSGSYPVVLSNRITAQLFSMFFSPYYADSVQKGQSRLAGKVGEVIASTDFNLLCCPHNAQLAGAKRFDGEGVITSDFSVVENGVLQTYLYNLETAAKEGVTSTGNAARSYGGKVGTSFSNAYVPPGTASLQDLLSANKNCFYVVKLEGGSGCSSVSGEISIGAQGFWVENGEKVHAVEAVTLSTNYFDLLKNIGMVGTEYNDQFSSVKIPDILVNNISISG
ncbi:MAG: TldD/PmbA family protein [Fibrobacterales bacterium]